MYLFHLFVFEYILLKTFGLIIDRKFNSSIVISNVI